MWHIWGIDLMIYTIKRLSGLPVVLVRAFPPMNINKSIYAIDAEVAHITSQTTGTLYRIDDLSNLGQQDFTLYDARNWFTGLVREDAIWRTRTIHIVIPSPSIRRIVAHMIFNGEQLQVSLVGSLPTALEHIRSQILRHNE